MKERAKQACCVVSSVVLDGAIEEKALLTRKALRQDGMVKCSQGTASLHVEDLASSSLARLSACFVTDLQQKLFFLSLKIGVPSSNSSACEDVDLCQLMSTVGSGACRYGRFCSLDNDTMTETIRFQ